MVGGPSVPCPKEPSGDAVLQAEADRRVVGWMALSPGDYALRTPVSVHLCSSHRKLSRTPVKREL